MKKAFIYMIVVAIFVFIGCGESNSYYTFGNFEDAVGNDATDLATLYKFSKLDFPEKYVVSKNKMIPIAVESEPLLFVEQNDRMLSTNGNVITKSLHQDLWATSTTSVIFFEKTDNKVYLQGIVDSGSKTQIYEKRLDTSFGFLNPKTSDARSLQHARIAYDRVHNLFYVCCALEGDSLMNTYVIDACTLSPVHVINITWSTVFVLLDNEGQLFFVDGNLFKGSTKYPSMSNSNIYYMKDWQDSFYISKDTNLLEYKSSEVVARWKFPIVVPANWLGFKTDGTPFVIKHISSGNYDLVYGVKSDS